MMKFDHGFRITSALRRVRNDDGSSSWRTLTEWSSWRTPGSILIFVVSLLAPTFAFAQYHTEWRTAYLECGKAQVRALAECYENTDFCISETLTFVRSGRRAIVGVHQHFESFALGKLKVQALDYHASSWACLPGKNGGHYVLVVVDHTGGTDNCGNECSFVQLYDPGGRLVAASMKFDARGRPRDNAAGTTLIRQLTGQPAPRAFAAIYKSR
jgi:hypothetical protein